MKILKDKKFLLVITVNIFICSAVIFFTYLYFNSGKNTINAPISAPRICATSKQNLNPIQKSLTTNIPITDDSDDHDLEYTFIYFTRIYEQKGTTRASRNGTSFLDLRMRIIYCYGLFWQILNLPKTIYITSPTGKTHKIKIVRKLATLFYNKGKKHQEIPAKEFYNCPYMKPHEWPIYDIFIPFGNSQWKSNLKGHENVWDRESPFIKTHLGLADFYTKIELDDLLPYNFERNMIKKLWDLNHDEDPATADYLDGNCQHLLRLHAGWNVYYFYGADNQFEFTKDTDVTHMNIWSGTTQPTGITMANNHRNNNKLILPLGNHQHHAIEKIFRSAMDFIKAENGAEKSCYTSMFYVEGDSAYGRRFRSIISGFKKKPNFDHPSLRKVSFGFVDDMYGSNFVDGVREYKKYSGLNDGTYDKTLTAEKKIVVFHEGNLITYKEHLEKKGN